MVRLVASGRSRGRRGMGEGGGKESGQRRALTRVVGKRVWTIAIVRPRPPLSSSSEERATAGRAACRGGARARAIANGAIVPRMRGGVGGDAPSRRLGERGRADDAGVFFSLARSAPGGEIETRREGTRAAAGTTRGRGAGRASANASAACAKDRERARVAGARGVARAGGGLCRGREERERRTKTAPALESGGAAGDGLLTERHTKSVLAARDRPEPRRRVRNSSFAKRSRALREWGESLSPAPAHSPPPQLVGTSTRARTSRLASGFSPSPPLGALARPPRHPRVASRSARTMRPPMGGRGGGGRGFGGGRRPAGAAASAAEAAAEAAAASTTGPRIPSSVRRPPDSVSRPGSRARARRGRGNRVVCCFFFTLARARPPRAPGFARQSSRRARR